MTEHLHAIGATLIAFLLAFQTATAATSPSSPPFNPRTRSSGIVTANASYSRWDPLPGHFSPFLRFSGREGDIVTYSVLIGVAADDKIAIKGDIP